MTSLEEVLDGPHPPNGGCPVCGEPNGAVVKVTVQKVDHRGGDNRSRSTTRSFCRDHAAARYLELTDNLKAVT